LEEREQLAELLNSPVGPELDTVRCFLVDWYEIWRDEEGRRRSLEDAQAHYETWRTNPAYRPVSKLKRVQERMTASKFERLSQFLRHPEWEATNNGAERTGRTFRHRQAPHFNLRTKEAIENAITDHRESLSGQRSGNATAASTISYLSAGSEKDGHYRHINVDYAVSVKMVHFYFVDNSFFHLASIVKYGRISEVKC
jgi:hypothetical protein